MKLITLSGLRRRPHPSEAGRHPSDGRGRRFVRPIAYPAFSSVRETSDGKSAHKFNAKSFRGATGRGFTFPDLLVVVAVVAVLCAVVLPILARSRAAGRQAVCESNLKEITKAVLLYTDESGGIFPEIDPRQQMGVWWFYKELIKGRMGMTGPSTARDKAFACPDDRGYDEPWPFHASAKFDYGSYVFNGVNLPGMPNLAGKKSGTVKEPAKTLLMMEWTAHAPLSWHKSRTGNKNQPFYNDAESMVGFVDGHVKLIKIYYDGINAAYSRDPISGYEYRYSAE